MSRCGDVYENRVTGEWAVILRGTEDRGDGPGIAHLTARPGAAVVGEHFHPHLIERFSVVRGRLSARIGGQSLSLGPGQSVTIEPGVVHDWWNASDSEDAHVLVAVDRVPGDEAVDANRFETLIGMLFGLANDGKVDRKGRPNPFQGALIAREFADVIVFTKPPPAVQRLLFAVLAPIGKALGYKAIYPHYCKPHTHIDPDPEMLNAAGLQQS
jgi:mannose-6-phosphate isomerase-like protein (cupin superfamily)